MKKWSVAVPITGVAYVEVEAEDEDEAIEKGIEAACERGEVDEWDAVRVIAEGNVCYAHTNYANATEIPLEASNRGEGENDGQR